MKMNFLAAQNEDFSFDPQVRGAEDAPGGISDYVSPLAARPSHPSKHYNPGTPTQYTYKEYKTKYNSYCSICDTKLNSHIQSKSHYEGKPHARKVKKTEEDANKKEQEATAPADQEGPPNKKARTVDVTSLYCGACNLTFTSEVHAKDHYLGRNHARVLHGLAPYTQGYYNTTTNKWQRMPPDPRVAAQLLSSEPPADMEGKPAHQDKPKIRGKFHCELCNCSLTCEQQQQSHLAGSRHAKVLKKLAEAADTGQTNRFQCHTCKVFVNSETQYRQHIESKRHLAAVAKTIGGPSNGSAQCSTSNGVGSAPSTALEASEESESQAENDQSYGPAEDEQSCALNENEQRFA